MSRGRIEKRGNSYRITVRVGRDPKNPNRYKRITETLPSYNQATKRVTQLLSDYDKGIIADAKKITVGQYLDMWLKDVVKTNLSRDTYQLYNCISSKHIIPNIGLIQLKNLKKQDLQHLLASKTDEGLTRTVALIRSIMVEALKNGIPDYLVRNIAAEIDVPRYTRKEFKVLSESDLHIVLEFARDSGYYELFYTYLFTAMRRAELLALRWGDVDLSVPEIHVNRTMQYLNKTKEEQEDKKEIDRIVYKDPKTEKSRRAIFLTPSNADVLKEYKEKINKMRIKLKMPELTNDDLVFCHFTGKPYTPDGISHAWMKLVRKCGLNGVRLHDARHTHATLLGKMGIPIKVIQERLGHARITTTLETYSHILPGMQKEASLKFDNLLLPKTAKTNDTK